MQPEAASITAGRSGASLVRSGIDDRVTVSPFGSDCALNRCGLRSLRRGVELDLGEMLRSRDPQDAVCRGAQAHEQGVAAEADLRAGIGEEFELLLLADVARAVS